MFEVERLPGGVTLLLEQVPYVRSACLGIYVSCGSRLETPEESGASHFLEHLAFKGTPTRSARALAEEMDRIGGRMNAYTSKERTCFYARALSEHLFTAADILCDMFLNPRLDPADVRTERGVILEEIGMDEDSPEDLVTERLMQRTFADTGLGRPILGTRTSLRGLSAPRLQAFRQRCYTAGGTVVALSGCFPEEIRPWLRERFSAWSTPERPAWEPARYTPAWTRCKKDIAQNHLCVSYPGLAAGDPRQAEMQLLSAMLGGSSSSRLFQTVREKLGLCYNVYSFSVGYQDAGLFSLYTAVNPATEQTALAAIRQETERFLQDGPDEDELARAREQAKASILMGMEGIQSRMSHMVRSYELYGRIQELDELVERYDAVTRESVLALARELMTPAGMSFSAVGTPAELSAYRRVLGA